MKMIIVCFAIIALVSGANAADTNRSNKAKDKRFLISNIDIRSLPAYPQNDLTLEKIQHTYKRSRNQFGEAVTLDELYVVVDDLGKLYRDYGYKFHSVFLPHQKLKDNKNARISILVARLGDVNVRGGDKGLNQELKRLFNPVLGKPLYQPNVDKIVLGIKAKYGIEVFPYYSRGSERGEVRLNIKATRSSRWVGSFSADNFGNDSTGKDRVTAVVTNYDLLGNLDSLSMGILKAVDGKENTYGFINYDTPVYSLDHTLSLSASNNQFDVEGGFESLGLEGDASLFGVQYSYDLSRSFDLQQRISAGVNYKKNTYDSLFNEPLLERDETSRTASLSWSLNYRPIASSWSYGVYIGVVGGNYEIEGLEQETDFYKGVLSQQFQWGIGDSQSWWFSSLKWSLKGQYSEEKLSSFELLPMSGAYGVRNVDSGYFGADRGGLAHLEWWLPNLVSSFSNVKVTPFVYYDLAYGERLTLNDTFVSRALLGGSGVGLQTTYNKHFILSVSAALSSNHDVGLNPEPEQTDFLVKLNYVIPH